ncbi:hypothetical protein [Streptomyces sp. UNOB3_S3]|uniref:hypothetical protein n=1 Tax=Streptomyces sp. UNOB3_S3 TaxID=2871682 RepID=UPI001E380B57|nr:hypothetical protein [Streptomyces sp. UNOB3_S3]MCC3774095.1 hypothetical protein [Streptomyces sp. UNOB3_S3]
MPQGLAQQDMVGTYRGEPFGTLTLKADGTYALDDWAHYDDLKGKYQHSGATDGVWKLAISEHVEGMPYDTPLTLRSADPSKGGGSFYVSGSRQKPRIAKYSGDPDECRLYEFNR